MDDQQLPDQTPPPGFETQTVPAGGVDPVIYETTGNIAEDAESVPESELVNESGHAADDDAVDAVP